MSDEIARLEPIAHGWRCALEALLNVDALLAHCAQIGFCDYLYSELKNAEKHPAGESLRVLQDYARAAGVRLSDCPKGLSCSACCACPEGAEGGEAGLPGRVPAARAACPACPEGAEGAPVELARGPEEDDAPSARALDGRYGQRIWTISTGSEHEGLSEKELRKLFADLVLMQMALTNMCKTRAEMLRKKYSAGSEITALLEKVLGAIRRSYGLNAL